MAARVLHLGAFILFFCFPLIRGSLSYFQFAKIYIDNYFSNAPGNCNCVMLDQLQV